MRMKPEEVSVHQTALYLPPNVLEKWKKIYADTFNSELEYEPDKQIAMLQENVERRHWKALRAANRLQTTPDVATYEEAKALEDWQVIKRVGEDGFLKVVTIDAKKYRFPIPGKSKG